MQIVLSKGKKTDLIALLVFCFCFLTENMADAYCVWLYWELYFFSVLRGWGQPSHSERTWVRRTFSMGRAGSAASRKEEAKPYVILSERSDWQGNILEFSFIFSATEECPYQNLLTSSACSLDSLALQCMGWAIQARLTRRRFIPEKEILKKKNWKHLFSPLPGTSN